MSTGTVWPPVLPSLLPDTDWLDWPTDELLPFTSVPGWAWPHPASRASIRAAARDRLSRFMCIPPCIVSVLPLCHG